MSSALFLGDCHGDLDFVVKACDLAVKHNAEIIQVGDWGFIWPVRNKGVHFESPNVRYDENQLLKLSSVLVAWGVTMRFIDGNHDWHPELTRLSHNQNLIGMEIAPRVIYQPRGSQHTDEDGTTFVFMGGAPSIDKAFRTDGVSWWATEEITDEQMEQGLHWGKCDVLVTHDAPDYPPGFLPKGDPKFRVASKRSLNNIKKLRTKLGPSLHMHGHWHHAHVDGVTRGLDCNYARYFNDSVYLWNKNQ